MNNPGKLFLIPVPVTDEGGLSQIPEYNLSIIRSLKNFIVEDAKTARRFLKTFGYPVIDQANLFLLNEHTKQENIKETVQSLLKGEDTGLMSDAGCPGIADPGADVVRFAHSHNIEVVPLVGPSSIVLSIMASGFNSQNFAFVGYLPIEKPAKIKKLKELEQTAVKQKQAQFFIETPYRNDQMFESLISTLAPNTHLFIGKGILSPDQYVKSAKIADWKKMNKPVINKVPVVFGIY